METSTSQERSFEILIRKKIPYWSALLVGCAFACVVFLMLLYFIMVPSNRTSGEMQAAYYILVVPEWLKMASSYSFLGMMVLIPLYTLSKTRKPAMLHITDEQLVISGAIEATIPVESIKSIFLNDVRPLLRKTEALEAVIRQRNGLVTSFLLRNYDQAEELGEALLRFNSVQFAFYNEGHIQIHDDDRLGGL